MVVGNDFKMVRPFVEQDVGHSYGVAEGRRDFEVIKPGRRLIEKAAI